MMRVGILFEGTGADYIGDIVLAGGLRAILGSRNVCWWPQKPHLAIDLCAPQAPEGSCWIGPPDCSVDLGVMQDKIVRRELDLLIVSNPNAEGFAGVFSDLIGLAQSHQVPVVMIDGDDKPKYDKLEILLPEGPWFIREAVSPITDHRIIAQPFAVNSLTSPGIKPWGHRDIDLLWGGTVHFNRTKFVEALDGFITTRPDLKIVTIKGRDVGLREWNDLLTRSKTCLCLIGAGRGTYRYFEAGAAGSVPIVQKHGLRIDNDYIMLAAPNFETPEQMLSVLTNLFTNDDLLRHAASEAYMQVMTGHLMTHRASEFLIRALNFFV